MINIAVEMFAIVVLLSCNKESETTRSSDTNKKNIPYFLSKMANDYSKEINAIADHIDDTLVFRCQGLSYFMPNLDTFKLKYVDSIAIGIGKNVYLGYTGNNSVAYVKGPNGLYVSTADLGNLYFYIYSDFYQQEPDTTYSIVNIRFLYNTKEPPFK